MEIVEALVTVGVPALVATQGGRMTSEIERLGGEIITMSAATKNPLEIFRNKQRLEQLISERNVSLLHARSRAPAWSSLLASARIDIPFVTTYHGAYGELAPFKRLYNSVMARGDIVIANSKFTADLVRARHQTQDSRLRIIYRGVALERFSQSTVTDAKLEQLRAKWDVPEEQKIIFHPARLTRLKGHGVLIDGIKELFLRTGKQNLVVIFAGNFEGRRAYVDELGQKIASLGLRDHIKFVGHCSDMASAYSLAHVTIIASTEPETFGRTSAESQAMGCPVIATNIGAPPETVRATPNVPQSEVTGWLVPPADPVALSNALEEVLTMSTDHYQQLTSRAIDNIRQSFSDKLMKAQTLAVYDELLGTDLASRYERNK